MCRQNLTFGGEYTEAGMGCRSVSEAVARLNCWSSSCKGNGNT